MSKERKYKTVKFYNEHGDHEGSIILKNTVNLSQLQDDIWNLLDDADCVAYAWEEDDDEGCSCGQRRDNTLNGG